MYFRLLIAAFLAVALALSVATKGETVASCPGADDIPTADTLATARIATLCLLNEERTSRGLVALRLNGRLTPASQAYSVDMVVNRYFEHVSPVTGSTLVARIKATRYLPRSGSWRLGENIAWGSGELATPAQTVDGWMHSPGHRHNILTPAFRDIGVGIAPGAPEDVDGLPAATYTTDFGARG